MASKKATEELTPEVLREKLNKDRFAEQLNPETEEQPKKREAKDKKEVTAPRLISGTLPSAETVLIPLMGTSPLEMSRIPDYAKSHIREGVMLPPNQRRYRFIPAVHPVVSFCQAIYCRRNGEKREVELVTPFDCPVEKKPIHFKASMIPGFPVTGFKKAIIQSARTMKMEWGLHIGALDNAVRVLGELAPIEFSRVELTEPFPKNLDGQTVYQVHSRFYDWSTFLLVRFFPSIIPLDQLIDVVNASGEISGVGASRIGKGRNCGGYEVPGEIPLETNLKKGSIADYLRESEEAPWGATLLEPTDLKMPKRTEAKDAKQSAEKGAAGKAAGAAKKVRKNHAADRSA